MTIIAGKELHDLIDCGVITARHENVNASSIDITLGDFIEIELDDVGNHSVHIADKMSPNFYSCNLTGCIEMIPPNKFFLAYSLEYFNLPNNISCEYKLKSSMARAGLEHLNSGWCDAGWCGQLTLEFKNILQYHNLAVSGGMKCGQMVFFKHAEVPDDQSYAANGSYNGSVGVTKAGQGES